jgi:DNA repair protein RadA/Sms
MKDKNFYICQVCGAQYPKWIGQCNNCDSWNSLVEEIHNKKSVSFSHDTNMSSSLMKLRDVPIEELNRTPIGIPDLDRVLGGGIVPGMAILIGGDPGIGKSTLLSQVLGLLGKDNVVLYISGEESLQQISIRTNRLTLDATKMYVVTETCIEHMFEHLHKIKPKVIVLDSIQTMFSEELASAPGSVSQVRESAAKLIQYAKKHQIALFIVGHVTKEGTIAGPRVLEHMVDTVLYFEGDKNSKFKLLRATKNRFGPLNELGVFVMTDKGLQTILNPSAIFLAEYDANTSGSMITSIWEGSRSLLIEVQALTDHSYLPTPRRVVIGTENNRLSMLLAVLHRFANVTSHDKDIYINVVGGLKITETAPDLALALALYTSINKITLSQKAVIFGEIGLSGEIRPAQYGLERVQEALRLGFKKAIIPLKNKPRKDIPGIEIYAAKNIQEAIKCLDHLK